MRADSSSGRSWITVATWIAVRLGLGRLPKLTGWQQVIGVSAIAGIGFTVSLFISGLAFTDPTLTDLSKIGIFTGSALAGIIGFAILRFGRHPDPANGDDEQIVDIIEPAAALAD